MKMCIPTRDERGMQSEVFDHFGSAPFFTLVDSESGQVEVEQNDNTHHGHGTCHPLRQFGSHSIDAVVCQAMGRGAVASLKEAGVRVFVLDGDAGHTVQSVVTAAREERPSMPMRIATPPNRARLRISRACSWSPLSSAHGC